MSILLAFSACETRQCVNIVPADDVRDCCVGTNDGQSYGVGPGNCEVY